MVRKKAVKDYTIGLDIGTNSVGWAVLTEDYHLVAKKMKVFGDFPKKKIKKNFWGVRLFDEGHTAADRRMKRIARRRYTRRRNRIQELQKIFYGEMESVDQYFFHRLVESFSTVDEKQHERYPIFATREEEIAYHEQFPTIYHLRKKLADSKEKADLRLIYLAVAHTIKYRGHFLIEGELNTENSSVKETFKVFLQEYNQAFSVQDDGSLLNPVDETVDGEGPFTERVSRARKAEAILKLFPNEKSNGTFMQFLKMIVGNQGNFKKTFSLEEDGKLQFPKEDYDELLEGMLAKSGDEYSDVFTAAKAVYEAVELSGILTVNNQTTKAKLSASMIERFEGHKADLEKFKKFIREQLPEKYVEVFKDKKAKGYAGYVAGGTSQSEFYKYTEKLIEPLDGSEYFVEKIAQESFLRKQRTFDNGVIPHQIHLGELTAILRRQGEYYPFLRENEEKIKGLLTFRIPYFIGPLSMGAKGKNKGIGNSEFAWLTRKSDEPITPWNLEEVVDLGQSATDFIEKMTNVDQYLPTEKVLPKHSMIYEKYTVLNELTKVTYMDEQGRKHRFSRSEKEKIFNDLFKNERKVKVTSLLNLLRNEYNIEAVKLEGVEQGFNASYRTYQDFVKWGVSRELLDAPENEQMFEELVKILTVFEDRKMIREQLSRFEHHFDKVVMKKLEKQHYTGWGRLSAKLIHGIRDKQTNKTILDFLVDDDDGGRNLRNRNFMQLINDTELSFKETIEKEQQTAVGKTDLDEVVHGLAGSPAIKKGILQSLKIVAELVAIMGYEPKTIVVEMARENQTTSQGRNNAKPRMKKLEEAIKELGSAILKDEPTTNRALQNDRLYLYYLQNGRDMYTGEELALHNLSSYDIDHIIPQSFTTDNSMDNRVLVSSAENRGKKDDVPSEIVVKKMKPLWESLYRSKLISEKKWLNLTKGERGGLSEEDKAGFIQRQLVETRQITKHVARILHQQYNAEKDEAGKVIRRVRIVTLKSVLTGQFRQTFELYKVREVNDYHHAHDAYLNGVIANTLLRVYPQLEPEFVYGDYRKFNSYKENKATAKKQFYSNLMRFFKKDERIVDENGEIVWDKQQAISVIKKVMGYRQMNSVKKVEQQTGKFSKETIQPKGDSAKLIARKNGWDPQKYGGFDSPIVAYSIVITHEKGKKRKVTKAFVGITIMEQKAFEKDPIAFLTNKGYQNPQVIIKLPKYSLFELENGRRRLLASAGEAQKGNQMVLPEHLVRLVYHAQRIEEITGDSLKYVEEHRAEFQELLDFVLIFAETYTLAEKNIKTLQALYEKNSNSDIKEIAESFVNLMTFNAMGAPAAFNFFGKKIDRYRYTTLTELLDGVVIFQSITGLYETRRDLGDI